MMIRGMSKRRTFGRGTFRSPPLFTGTFAITGVTKDSTGVALGNCVVQLFRTGDDVLVQETSSDGSGNYTCNPPNNAGYFYIVAYKAGSPDVAGTTVNTLAAV